MPAFTYGAKSQKRLTVACDLIRFYQTVGRDLTAANIQLNEVMSNFEIQWKALKDRKEQTSLPSGPLTTIIQLQGSIKQPQVLTHLK